MTFRWDGPQFKTPVSAKVTKGLKREQHVSREKAQMDETRKRDKYCRFPMCGCKRFSLTAHVAHLTHRGMGGNPKEDRSEPEKMILLCSARHRDNEFSLDQKTVRIRPLTLAGTSGPCAFDVRGYSMYKMDWGKWSEVGRETALHQFEPFTPEQLHILTMLKGMER